MKNNYIIGAGPAGLIAAYYMEDYKIIDKNPLGQLKAPFIPGPRLLQNTKNMSELIDEIFGGDTRVEIAKIGYMENGVVTDKPCEGFKSKYVEKTRGTKSIEGSHLSEGKNEIEHIEIGFLTEESYGEVFNRLLKIIKDRGQLIQQSISNIDVVNKTITINDDQQIHPLIYGKYDNIISTINLNVLSKLAPDMDIDLTEFKTKTKCFYKTSYDWMCEQINNYSYIYSADEEWTRKTYFDNYIVYESVDPINSKTIEENIVKIKFENLPIQIVESKNIDSINGIKMLGRFAQWNHKVKANEVLDRVKSWIN